LEVYNCAAPPDVRGLLKGGRIQTIPAAGPLRPPAQAEAWAGIATGWTPETGAQHPMFEEMPSAREIVSSFLAD
jgi:hypothetical protein